MKTIINHRQDPFNDSYNAIKRRMPLVAGWHMNRAAMLNDMTLIGRIWDAFEPRSQRMLVIRLGWDGNEA